MDWPCWIVLAPGTLKLLEPTISKIAKHHRQDRRPWALVEGKRGYVAIIEEEPGSHGVKDEALAKALSKKTKKPAFIVTLDDDYSPSRVEAFARGKSKGKVKATANDVLVTLGFRFDWMSGGKKVALRVEAPMVNAKAGEAMIWHWSVSQWQQMRRRDDDWHILLDFVGGEIIDEVIGICGDPDAEVRLLGATMLQHVGYYGLNIAKRLAATIATLDKLAVDRSKKVSAIAIEARDHIVERGEYEGVRAKFPWILNYEEKFLKRALALLAENRPIVHRYIYDWIARGTWNNKALPKFAVAKLRQLAKTSPRARALLAEL